MGMDGNDLFPPWIYRYSSIRQYHFVTDNSDEDTYVDSFSDIDSNESDDYDDIEPILLDQLEMEHDIDVFESSQEYQDEEWSNYHDNHYRCT